MKTCTFVGSSVSLGADSEILVSQQEEKYLQCDHGVKSPYWVFANIQDSDSKTHTRWLFDTPTWTMVISLDLIHVIVDLNLHG